MCACVRVHVSVVCSVMFDSLWPYGLQPLAPLSMGFSIQEYWSGLPFPSSGDLPDPGIELRSPALQEDSLLSEPLGASPSQGSGATKDADVTWGLRCPEFGTDFTYVLPSTLRKLPLLGLMFCCCFLIILNNFWTMHLHFPFALNPENYLACLCLYYFSLFPWELEKSFSFSDVWGMLIVGECLDYKIWSLFHDVWF